MFPDTGYTIHSLAAFTGSLGDFTSELVAGLTADVHLALDFGHSVDESLRDLSEHVQVLNVLLGHCSEVFHVAALQGVGLELSSLHLFLTNVALQHHFLALSHMFLIVDLEKLVLTSRTNRGLLLTVFVVIV